jgi:heme/copper-type cytochrome/quinol oxidase subunit 1
VLSMGAVFAIFAGWYYWIGKIIGNQYNEVLGKIHFWATFVGVNVLFLSNALPWISWNASSNPRLPRFVLRLK